MASITMSANSSELDVTPGAGVGVGSALAAPIANVDRPMIAPATTQRSPVISLLASAIACFLAAQPDSPAKLAPDRIHCTLERTNVDLCQVGIRLQEGLERMLKGFKEFLSRGNIVDLSVAVVIGTAFTALVTKFTDSIIQPLINRIGAGDSDYGILRINIGGGQTIDLNILLSAAINFILVAAVVYFLVVMPYNRLRKKGEVEQAQDTELSLLTEIRNLLAETNGQAGKHVSGPGTGPSPDTAETTSADRS
jgi:large conductance mechanosensitive channel